MMALASNERYVQNISFLEESIVIARQVLWLQMKGLYRIYHYLWILAETIIIAR